MLLPLLLRITPIGVVLIWLGLLALFFRPRSLLYLAVFFAPFTSTGVYIFPSQQFLPAWTFFTLLALVAGIGRRDRSRSNSTNMISLVIFGLSCLLSLLVAWFIDGTFFVRSATPKDFGSLRPVNFDKGNLIVLLPLLTALAMIWLIVKRSEDGEFARVLRTSVLGITAVAGLGFWEFLRFSIGLPYPGSLFRAQDPNRIANLDTSVGLRRLASATAESSVLAQVLIIGFCILLVAHWWRTTIVTPRFDKWALALISTVLVLSVSSTALVGLIAATAACYLAVLFGRAGRVRPVLKASFTLAIVGAVVWLCFTRLPVVEKLVTDYLLEKNKSASYRLRHLITSRAWTSFHHYPLLGVGLGNSPSSDLLGELLSNVGIIGTAAFFGCVGNALRRAGRVAWSRVQGANAQLAAARAQGIFVALAMLLLLTYVSGFVFETAQFWLAVGLALGVAVPQFPAAHPQPLSAEGYRGAEAGHAPDLEPT